MQSASLDPVSKAPLNFLHSSWRVMVPEHLVFQAPPPLCYIVLPKDFCFLNFFQKWKQIPKLEGFEITHRQPFQSQKGAHPHVSITYLYNPIPTATHLHYRIYHPLQKYWDVNQIFKSNMDLKVSIAWAGHRMPQWCPGLLCPQVTALAGRCSQSLKRGLRWMSGGRGPEKGMFFPAAPVIWIISWWQKKLGEEKTTALC